MADRRRILVWTALAVGAVALGLGSRLFYDRMERGAVGVADLGGAFELVDHDGETITEAAFEGQPSALFFGFTHCPEICPTTVYEIENWMRELGPEADAFRAWFVTIDPERDTPAVLKEYLEFQTDRVTGISGPPEAVLAMADDWRVYHNRVPLEGGDYTMDHTSLVYLLDEDGQYADLIRYGEEPESAVAKIRALLDG
jgi:protein SCO1/2